MKARRLNLLQCSNSKRASRADERRRHLLDVSRALFVEHGFHQTGVAQIAAASGIKVGQIYRDFASKEDIIAAMAEVDIRDFLDEASLRTAVEAQDKVAIRAWVDRFVSIDDTVEECRMSTEILAEVGRNPRIADIHRRIDQRMRQCLAAALEALAPASADGEREALSDLIMMLGMGMMIRRVIDPDRDWAVIARRVGGIVDSQLDALRRDGAL